jgi:hypothetical protein
MVPMTVNAGENKTLVLNKDYIISDEFTGYIMANTSDNVSIHWKQGNLHQNSMICFITPESALSWNLNTFVGQATGCGYTWHANPGMFRYVYWIPDNPVSSLAPPGTFWIKPSSTGLIFILIFTSDNVQCTFNFTVTSGNYYVNQSSINNINNHLTQIENTLSELNKTISGLGNDSVLWNITKDIATLQKQILYLTNQTNINSINIFILENSIIDLQKKIDDIRAQIKTINSTMITNVSITQRVNLTTINGSLNNLTTALTNLNITVQSLDIPPDMQSDVNKLKQENTQLKNELTALQKKVGVMNSSVVVNNNTLYNNTTTTKKVSDDVSMIKTAVVGGGLGASIGCVVGAIAVGGRKKKEDPQGTEQLNVYQDITESTEVQLKVDEPEKREDTIDEILGKLKPEDKTKLKSKTVDGEVDEVPLKQVKDKPTQKITIGGKVYTESDILSRLTSLPRGLPNEFFSKDISELAGILMGVKYIIDADDEITFLYNKKKYYGNPDNVGTYMQRYKGL